MLKRAAVACAGAGFMLVVAAGAASADYASPKAPPEEPFAVRGETVTNTPVVDPVVAAAVVSPTSSPQLPRTGSDVLEFLLLGGAAIGGGSILVRVGRRRTQLI